MQEHDEAQRYRCCICLNEPVRATEHACEACREVFTLPESRFVDPDRGDRVQIGPTDI